MALWPFTGWEPKTTRSKRYPSNKSALVEKQFFRPEKAHIEET